MTRIRLAKPSVGGDELAEIERVIATGYLTQGRAVANFEQGFASMIGTTYAFATSSATTALHLSLAALGVGTGDEVVVPAYTFPATANVVVQQGAIPVIADVDPVTFAMTRETLASAVTPRTVAVIPVDPFGYPAPMQELCAFAEERGLRVIEDAACAIGARRGGHACGSFPDVGCFSFHPRKVITTGEGGMITTNDADVAERITLLRNHGGARRDGRYVFESAGFNYRLSDIAGAMGVAQLKKLPWLLATRLERARLMSRLLADVPGLLVPHEESGTVGTYQSYVVMLDEQYDRDSVIRALDRLGIETTIGTYGLHLEPYFRDRYALTPEMYPDATRAARHSLALPMYPDLTEDDVHRVADALTQVLTDEAVGAVQQSRSA
jgi:dTDP-4-amino-4,6-dideoxygalactose transaminase